jgi:hypothetical protein
LSSSVGPTGEAEEMAGEAVVFVQPFGLEVEFLVLLELDDIS